MHYKSVQEERVHVVGVARIIAPSPLSQRAFSTDSDDNVTVHDPRGPQYADLGTFHLHHVVRESSSGVAPRNRENADPFYESIVEPAVVEPLLSGISCALIAYGPGGGGKTSFLLGTQGAADSGVLWKVTRDLLRLVGAPSSSSRLGTLQRHLSVTAFEVRDERLSDAFASTGWSQTLGEANSGGLRIHSSSNGTGVLVDGLTVVPIRSIEEINAALEVLRRQPATPRSSSSKVEVAKGHTTLFIQLHMEQLDRVTRQGSKSVMTLVDCCGSDKSNRARLPGSHCRTYVTLQGLHAVVESVVERQSKNLTLSATLYRSSVVTRLLSEAVGGSWRAVVVACINTAGSAEEAAHALAFTARCMKVTCHPVPCEGGRAPVTISELQKELARLRSLLASAEVGDATQGHEAVVELDQRVQSYEFEIRRAAERLAELEKLRDAAAAHAAEQELRLEEANSELQRKNGALEDARRLDNEILRVSQQQTTATQQMADTAAAKEKCGAQLVVHRQRHASFVRRHEQMVGKAEVARREAEEHRQQQLSAIFRCATALGKHRRDVMTLRSAIETLHTAENEAFTALRRRHTDIAHLTAFNRDEQFKCDLLADELGGTTSELRKTAESLAASKQAHQDAIRMLHASTDECRAAEREAEIEVERLSLARHHSTFEWGVAALELEAAAQAAERDNAAAEVHLKTLTEATNVLQRRVAKGTAATATAADLETHLASIRHEGMAAEGEAQRLHKEIYDIGVQLQNLETIAIRDAESSVRAASQSLATVSAESGRLLQSQQRLATFLHKRVFPYELGAF